MRKLLFFGLLCGLVSNTTWACSAFRMEFNGAVVVGCNEDAWRLTPHIWIEHRDQHSACFTGSRAIAQGRFAPQSGMNSAGLVFTRLAAHSVVQPEHPSHSLPSIADDAAFLTEILLTCSSVSEVATKVEQFNRSRFLGDVLMFVDAAGTALVVEPYALVWPDDDGAYLISNFCPSSTPEEDRRNLGRYRLGMELMESGEDVAPVQLSKSMAVDRPRHGDGTLLTSLWEPEGQRVTLYFYHDFDEAVTIDLRAAWAEGWTIKPIEELFSRNEGFQRLKWHPTPHQYEGGREVFAGVGLLLMAISFLWWRQRIRWAQAAAIAWSGAFMVLLAAHQPIWYFPLPYEHAEWPWVAWASWSPWGIMVLHAIGGWRGREWVGLDLWAKSLGVVTLGAFLHWKFFVTGL